MKFVGFQPKDNLLRGTEEEIAVLRIVNATLDYLLALQFL